MLADRLGAVEHDDLGLLAEGLPEAEAEVHRDADDERHVGALERRAARAGEEELVVGRHAAARQAVEEHRDPQLLGQRQQRVLAVAPVEVGPGHDHRPLGAAQQRRGALEGAAVGRRPAGRVGQLGRASSPSSASMKTWSSGKSRNAGPGVRRERGGQRLVDEPRDLGRRLRRRRELDQRRDERHVVDLLQRALPPAHRGRTAAEDEHRRSVLLGGGQRAHPVRHARPRGQRRHAGTAGHLGPALGGERGGRLVADVDDVDALRAAAVVDREQVAARQREQLRDAVGLQPPRDEAPAMQAGRLLGLRAHRRSVPAPAGEAGPGAVTAAPGAWAAEHGGRVDTDRLALAAQLDRRALHEAAVVALQQAQGRLRDQHGVAGLARELLDARRGVDGVADHGELQAPAAADRAGHHDARVDADADPQVAAVHVVDEHAAISIAASTARSAWPGRRSGAPKTASSPSPTNLFAWPPWRTRTGHDVLVEAVEPRDHLARVSPLGVGGEVADVEEQHGDLDLLAGEHGALLEDPLGQARVHEGAEGIAQPVALLQADHHLVEGACQLTGLVRADDRDAHVEVALGDPLRPAPQVAQRARRSRAAGGASARRRP